jgi:hypothetical protein
MLAFVVAGSNADRVDIAPIFFRLRMHQRVTIDFARGGLKDADARAFGEPSILIAPCTLVLVVCTGSRW